MIPPLATPLRLLPALVAFTLAGCAGERSTQTHILVLDEETANDLETAALAQGLVAFDAEGGIVPALAASWHVSDDGLSYIFRLDDARWSDGEPVAADRVARTLARRFEEASVPFGDTVGAIEDIEAMTDRVIEIRLNSPRPFLLQLLAQPTFAIRDGDVATGPFTVLPSEVDDDEEGAILLGRLADDMDEEVVSEQRVMIEQAGIVDALERFAAGEVDLVTGGRFDTLPLAQEASGLFGAPRIDPVAGLFGLRPVGDSALLADSELRGALNRAIDRDALVRSLGVSGLLPRATILQSGLDVPSDATVPDFVQADLEARRSGARALLEERDLDGSTVTVDLPQGPGADTLFQRLVADWGTIGLRVERANGPSNADFVLVDAVAPAMNAGWYLNHFRCDRSTICSEETDSLLDRARDTRDLAERRQALLEATLRIQDQALFLPLAAPVRWSLVGPGLDGFVENRFARHDAGLLRSREGRR